MNNEEITSNRLYDEIIKNRNVVQAIETRLLLKLEEYKAQIKKLEEENNEIREKLELVSRQEKKKNLIIFGLKNIDTIPKYICEQLNQYLEINITEKDISDVYKLGKNDNSPIKIEFVSYLTKKLILQNCYKLKGKNLNIAHDQTPQQRANSKVLRKHLLLAKQEGHEKCFIKNEKLYVGGEVYSVEELWRSETVSRRSNSAPSSPIINNGGSLSPKCSVSNCREGTILREDLASEPHEVEKNPKNQAQSDLSKPSQTTPKVVTRNRSNYPIDNGQRRTTRKNSVNIS